MPRSSRKARQVWDCKSCTTSDWNSRSVPGRTCFSVLIKLSTTFHSITILNLNNGFSCYGKKMWQPTEYIFLLKLSFAFHLWNLAQPCIVCDNGTGFVKVRDMSWRTLKSPSLTGFVGCLLSPGWICRPKFPLVHLSFHDWSSNFKSWGGVSYAHYHTLWFLCWGLSWLCGYHSFRVSFQAISDTIELKDIMCGDEAAAVRQSLDIKYPVRYWYLLVLWSRYA